MKAKRAKQQRKTMQTYQMHYAFREPYQVLITSDCLRALHAFAMDIQKFLENTLQGKMTPYITQCTLAKVMEGFSGKGRDGRPAYLPPPTEVPLRYCKHKDGEGKERGVIPEVECLHDLISGQAKGNEQKKNKNHYILAGADWDEGIKDQGERDKLDNQRRKRRKLGQPDIDIRDHARVIPGVPIIYVKRSVMILEEPSAATTKAIRKVEKDKFKDGIGGAVRGVKRDREDDESDMDAPQRAGPQARSTKRVKGPNPLAVKKKKPKVREESKAASQIDVTTGQTDVINKKVRRKRGKGGATTDAHMEEPESAE